MKTTSLLMILGCMLATSPASGKTYLTPWAGYTLGGEVKDQNDTEYRIKGSESFALSLDNDFDNGRIGLFYSYQKSKVKKLNVDTNMQYLLFQSSIPYEWAQDFFGYMGAAVGGSYIDADWTNDYGFAASIFGGFEYQMWQNLYVNGQVRWLGTSVDGNTSGACTLSGSSSCTVQFTTDWVNQYAANLGVTVVF